MFTLGQDANAKFDEMRMKGFGKDDMHVKGFAEMFWNELSQDNRTAYHWVWPAPKPKMASDKAKYYETAILKRHEEQEIGL